MQHESVGPSRSSLIKINALSVNYQRLSHLEQVLLLREERGVSLSLQKVSTREYMPAKLSVTARPCFRSPSLSSQALSALTCSLRCHPARKSLSVPAAGGKTSRLSSPLHPVYTPGLPRLTAGNTHTSLLSLLLLLLLLLFSRHWVGRRLSRD